MISPSLTNHPWTLSKWEGLSGHPSPFVRKWVARNAKEYLDQQSRSLLIKCLLQDEKSPIRELARHDLLGSLMPDLSDHYLELAQEAETWGQRRSRALNALAGLGERDRLIQSLHTISERIQAGQSQSEALVQDLIRLPLALPRMSLPEKRLELCREQAETLRRSRSPSPDPTHSRERVNRDSDLGRLQRMDLLLEIILDDAGRRLIDEDIAEMSALALLILPAAGQTCWGRSRADMTDQEMLTILAEDRPGMIQDWILNSCLTQQPEKTDSVFRERLLQCSESALGSYPSSWGKRVLSLAPDYKLMELIPQLMEMFLNTTKEVDHPDVSFVETLLNRFHSPVVWTEYARQAGLKKGSGSWATQDSIPSERDLWFNFLVLQKNPCPDAADWIEANFQALLPENETELLEAVLASGDQRFIPRLESILAEEEIERKWVFQTLCRLHEDPRAFNESEEDELWEKEEERYRELHFISQRFLSSPLEEFLDEQKLLRLQLRCDQCQGIFHYKPKRIVVYPPKEEGLQFAIDVGGDIVCKACQATAEHLDLTTGGRNQISAAMFTRLQGKVDLLEDVEILNQDKPCDKQVFVLPQGTTVLGEPVRNMKEGLEVYARKLASDPGNPKFLVGRANIYKRLLRRREARQDFLEALESDPNCLDAMMSLGEMCRRQGQGEEAWEWLQKAYQHVS